MAIRRWGPCGTPPRMDPPGPTPDDGQTHLTPTTPRRTPSTRRLWSALTASLPVAALVLTAACSSGGTSGDVTPTIAPTTVPTASTVPIAYAPLTDTALITTDQAGQ